MVLSFSSNCENGYCIRDYREHYTRSGYWTGRFIQEDVRLGSLFSVRSEDKIECVQERALRTDALSPASPLSIVRLFQKNHPFH